MSTNIPTPETMSPAFLTKCLREAGHKGIEVQRASGTQIGTGQVGQCIRYELELDHASEDAPRSLVGKYPSDDPMSRQTGIQLRNYLKEVSFHLRSP